MSNESSAARWVIFRCLWMIDKDGNVQLLGVQLWQAGLKAFSFILIVSDSLTTLVESWVGRCCKDKDQINANKGGGFSRILPLLSCVSYWILVKNQEKKECWLHRKGIFCTAS